MKVSTERLEKSQMTLEVEVDPEQLEKSMERAYRRLVNRTTVPGFRKGKAPRAMLERYLGKATLLSEAIDIAVPEAYTQAIEEQQVPAFGQPQIEILQLEPLSFKATVNLEPAVTLGDLSQLDFKLEVPEVTEEQISEVLNEVRTGSAPWEPVERAAAPGDMVTMDVHSEVETETGPTPYINQDAAGYVIDLERNEPMAGFAEQLVGMAQDETRSFSINLPEDYPAQSLAGKPVKFTVTVHEVKEKRLPELDDEFARGVGPGYASMQELRDRIIEDLKQNAEKDARDKLQEQIIDAVVEQAQVEYPDVLVEHEIEHLIESDRSVYRDQQGRIDDYLAAIGQTEEAFKERYREGATKRVLRSLVLQEVAAQEAIEVSEEDLDGEIDKMLEGTSEQNREPLRAFFNTPERRASLQRTMTGRRTLERLVAIATHEVAPTPRAATEAASEEAPAQLQT